MDAGDEITLHRGALARLIISNEALLGERNACRREALSLRDAMSKSKDECQANRNADRATIKQLRLGKGIFVGVSFGLATLLVLDALNDR